MKIVETISISELKQMAEKMYGTIVKADVDIAKNVVIVDMDMHFDGEQELLEQGSNQQDIWGINFHPAKYDTDEFVEFDSMINIRPAQGNMSRDVESIEVRKQILEIVDQHVVA